MLICNILDETEAESDAESDISDHEDFFLPGEEHYIKMEVSATRREKIKQLFYSNQVTYISNEFHISIIRYFQQV